MTLRDGINLAIEKKMQKKMLRLIPDNKVVLVSRDANATADWVAVNTRKGMCTSSWIRQLPSLVGILDKGWILCSTLMNLS
ncbi:hypothetical protein CRYUN_Cryun34aG0097700 [Craigia yunnanensis]